MSKFDLSAVEGICKEHKCVCKRDLTLAPLTTMKIGGECELFAEPNSEECLLALLKCCRSEKIPYFILGKGSNVLINRFHGVIIHIGKNMGVVSVDGETITAGAGASLANVCTAALEHSLSGMENLYGIPGSVGGALYMNAGAYGSEMKDVVVSARCVDRDGNMVEVPAAEMALSYRHSAFSENGMIIVSVMFLLKKGEKAAILARQNEVIQKRRDKQPLEFPSCGSTFKRPEGYFAAALIEECGLKGCSIGGAEVSRKHSGFVINKGGATFEDVTALVAHIKKAVKEQKGVELECEMIILDK